MLTLIRLRSSFFSENILQTAPRTSYYTASGGTQGHGVLTLVMLKLILGFMGQPDPFKVSSVSTRCFYDDPFLDRLLLQKIGR